MDAYLRNTNNQVLNSKKGEVEKLDNEANPWWQQLSAAFL